MEKQVSTSTPPSSSTDGTKRDQTCVVVPTTGGLVWIRSLKKRPRLKASYAIMDGDFRPLKLSKDYHYFVTGPLTLVQDPAKVFELSLSDNIDSGRSWEFPTLLAHLLEKQEKLSFANADKLEEAGDPGYDLIWATGMLDPDLSPVAADYKLARKLELSRPLFENCVKHGRAIRIFLCADLPASERAMFKQAAQEFQADYHEISTLAEMTKIVGGAVSTPDDTSKKHPSDHAEPGLQQGTVFKSPVKKSWLVKGLVAGGIAALFFWAAYAVFGPGPSTTLGKLENSTLNSLAAFSIEQLSANDQNDCRKHIMMAQRFDTKELLPKQAKLYGLVSRDGLCGLRIRNTGASPMRLQLSDSLEGYAIPGNGSLFQGRELRIGKYVDLYLSRLPTDLRAQLTVTPEGGEKSRFFIEFTRSAPER